MGQDDEAYYRKQAEDAQKQADRAITDRDHANWLRLAQSWMSLIKGRPRTDSETFDDAARDRGTNQDISKKSQ